MFFFSSHKKRFFSFIIFVFSFFLSFSQSSLLFPNDYFFDIPRQKALFTDTSQIIHSSMQPVPYEDIAPDTFKQIKSRKSPFFNRLFCEDLIRVKYTDKTDGHDRLFKLSVNPILNMSYGKDLGDTTNRKIYNNTRGLWIKGQIGKNFWFESSFFENQSFFPAYLQNYCNASQIVPGQGRWKTFKQTGFDYAMSCGVIRYKISKNLAVQLGTGKQKVGTGYRSLLLSDNSFNYPYLQISTNLFHNKVQYTQTYALLMNLSDGGTRIPVGTERIYQKKAASFQHLSWQVNRHINLYFFQGMVWKATDSNNVMHLDAWYFNPVIYTNLAKYGFNNSNHIVTGLGYEIKMLKKTALYCQFVYDGQTNNTDNSGLQLGIKVFDLFRIKNLYFQYEFNDLFGAPYYSPVSAQDYSHYNQLLTTPAPFSNEMIGLLSYTYKRAFIQLKGNYSYSGGPNQYLYFFDGKIGYTINPAYNFNISIGSTYRQFENDPFATTQRTIYQTQLFYVSLKTSLYNIYYDF